MDTKALLNDLKKLVTDLSADLLARSTSKDDPYSAEVDAGLREAYSQIEKGGRTADAFEVWREDYLDQVAVAWVLGCVFVRFMEDNHLIDECWLAGESERRKLAENTHELYFREHPHESDREYFEHVFREVGKIPACRDLFAEGKTPLWAVGPSGDMAMKLLGFWREIDAETGHLARSFVVKDGDTRFLGDLYQDLSERARKKYALLQTPVFVEEFILERTLDPAIDEFGLDEVRMIDPTCGSGHFLLGGFARLFDLWIKREDNEVVAAQKALDGVWGCDINPFAVAIARFRLIVAALKACDIKRLKDAPAWNIHLATGDSLLFGSRWDREGKKKGEQQFFSTDEKSWAPEIYACENKEAISEILGQQYHAVVGNPPYITCKDKRLNEAYRERFSSCHRQFSLGVPFSERFFDLCKTGAASSSGFVGLITTNSFMKREFGKKLVEEFLSRVDLTHVVDSSVASIPGHGTPTVILFGRNKRPEGECVRAVMGIKGEPRTPKDPSQGLVWQSIVRHIDNAGAEDEFTSATDVPRNIFASHPWSLSGGGAIKVMDLLENNAETRLRDHGDVGIASWAGLDDVFAADAATMRRKKWEREVVKDFVTGDTIRDWSIRPILKIAAPFSENGEILPESSLRNCCRSWWESKSHLDSRVLIGGKTFQESGIDFYGWVRWISDRYRNRYRITFPSVATHNHFALERGGVVFNRHAPIILLHGDAGEEEHLSLLGVLNSSTACFWMQNTLHNKGGPGGASSKDEKWHDFFEFSGTALSRLPLPQEGPLQIATELDRVGTESSVALRNRFCNGKVPSDEDLASVKLELSENRRRMIALQEELDWQCLYSYGLLDQPLNYDAGDLPDISPGQRAFEIAMARRLEIGSLETKWFSWLGVTPIVEIPQEWPDAYRAIVERRIDAIENNKHIRLIECPNCKRRWEEDPWTSVEERFLRNWLLDRLESQHFWPNPQQHEPRLRSLAELADKASADKEFLQVAAVYRGREDFSTAVLVSELVESESVPLLPVLRYKPAGIRKRLVWENNWELQRRADRGEAVGAAKVPPKYSSSDFQKPDYWRLRGKLDVPKERWISFPHCETESNPALVVGWAGWNHLQQATAIVAYYDARKREGWDAKRLIPLLAAIDQLIPWIHQWHPEVDPEFGETAGQSFQTLLESDAHELGLTLEEIRAWEPPKRTTTRRTRKKK